MLAENGWTEGVYNDQKPSATLQTGWKDPAFVAASLFGIGRLALSLPSLLMNGTAAACADGNCENEAQAVNQALNNARQLGRAGEIASGIVKNTTRIPSLTNTAAYRIPDGLTNTTIFEVKNVATLSYTNQLKDFVTYAQSNNLTFELFVRPTTTLSQPLSDAIANGYIILKFLPE